MKKTIKLSLAVLLLGIIGLMTWRGVANKQSNSEDTWTRVTSQKKIVIGLDDSFVPMGFQKQNGQIVGYDVDLAKAVFKQYGVKVDFQPMDWSMNVTELRNKTIDLIWNGFSINPQRAQAVLFSEPYLDNQQVLISKTKDHVNSFADMKGKVVGVQSGSTGAIQMDKRPALLKNLVKNQEPILYSSFTDAFIDLNAGRIQGLLIDSVYAGYYINHQPHPEQYVQVKSEFNAEKYAVGMRKEDTLLKQKIDQGLNRLAQNGELARINAKWFNNRVHSPLIK